MKQYQCWSLHTPMEVVEAIDSYAARKEFARKHRLQVSEVMSRRRA